MGAHLAEMLLDLKYRGRKDPFRKKRAFAESIEAVHAILFNPSYPKRGRNCRLSQVVGG